jgi:21S rRNA (uridine2791-2'-O)-methyltransferase
MIGEEIGYIDMAERDGSTDQVSLEEGREKGIVDVVLSDMSEPWPQTEGFWKNYLTEAYFRMMNVSGIRVKDHGDSMVLNRPLFRLADGRIYVMRRCCLRWMC